MLTELDFAEAALHLRCQVAAIKAVCQVEAPNGGFDTTGQPRILFEGHIFSRLTSGLYDETYPTISYPTWTRKFYAKGADSDIRNAGEHKRMQQAAALNRDAALKSASWGKFQILGNNHASAGFPSVQSFINAMYAGEGAQLNAFVNFVRLDRGGAMARALKQLDWATFARLYNGPAYALNKYDERLADAYQEAL